MCLFSYSRGPGVVRAQGHLILADHWSFPVILGDLGHFLAKEGKAAQNATFINGFCMVFYGGFSRISKVSCDFLLIS